MEPRAPELARINTIVPLENLRTGNRIQMFVERTTPVGSARDMYAKARIQGYETDTLGKKRGHHLDLVFKNVPDLAKYKAGLLLADKAKLPTCPDVYMVGPKAVGMTNLTADGSQLFGKAYNDALYRRTGLLTKSEQQFLRIPPEAIQQKIKEIVEQATANNLHLPTDDLPECVVPPNGPFRLIILEVDGLKLQPNDPFLLDDNWRLGNQCLAIFQNIRTSLSKKKP